jgi:hypothetical protein
LIGLPKLSILVPQGAYAVPITCYPSTSCFDEAILVFAHVAGFDYAIYGLPDPENMQPLLFSYKSEFLSDMPPTLVSTVKLSGLVTSRFMPMQSWQQVWNTIFAFVDPTTNLILPDWKPVVGPTYDKDTVLPKDAELTAFKRAYNWISNSSGLVVQPGSTSYNVAEVCLAPYAPDPNQVTCVLEGYTSEINWDGTQNHTLNVRADCNGEVAMMFAVASMINLTSTTKAVALMDYLWKYSELHRGPRSNWSNPAYGNIGWAVTDPVNLGVYYGDDNARVILSSLVAASILKTNTWDVPILRGILGNLRTTSHWGYRPGDIVQSDLDQNGWQYYFYGDCEINNCQWPEPHFQSYMWAVFIWAYHHTGYEMFLKRAEVAIEAYMNKYPLTKWVESFSTEQARMLLPLSWLVRVHDTPKHRYWLKKIAEDLLSRQHTSGAIEEWLGPPGMCEDCPPSSNDAFGTGEAPIIQEDGDSCADLLYTQNFAVLGLLEASKAVPNEPLYKAGMEQLVQFLIRVQVKSQKYQFLEGAWYRAFDYELWEFYGSSSDWGWGPWCIESGWTGPWISAVMAFRLLNTSVWDITASSSINPVLFDKLCTQFFPFQYCN